MIYFQYNKCKQFDIFFAASFALCRYASPKQSTQKMALLQALCGESKSDRIYDVEIVVLEKERIV